MLSKKKSKKTRRKNNHSGPEGFPFDSKDGIRSAVFGPVLWFLLSCVARNYPVNPTPLQKKKHQLFIEVLEYILPCGSCRDNYAGNLVSAQWDPDIHLKDRQSFSRFINHLHNIVNKMLHKNMTYTYEEHRQIFESFRAKCHKKNVSKKEEGGCTGDLTSHDPRATCIINIMPERQANKIMGKNKNCSLIVDPLCRRKGLLLPPEKTKTKKKKLKKTKRKKK
jgi:hypothetical protein